MLQYRDRLFEVNPEAFKFSSNKLTLPVEMKIMIFNWLNLMQIRSYEQIEKSTFE